jgi:hypothetical protein
VGDYDYLGVGISPPGLLGDVLTTGNNVRKSPEQCPGQLPVCPLALRSVTIWDLEAWPIIHRQDPGNSTKHGGSSRQAGSSPGEDLKVDDAFGVLSSPPKKMAQIPDLQAQMIERLWTGWLIDQKEFDPSRIANHVWVSPTWNCGKHCQLQSFYFRECVAETSDDLRDTIKLQGVKLRGDQEHRQPRGRDTGLSVKSLVSNLTLYHL